MKKRYLYDFDAEKGFNENKFMYEVIPDMLYLDSDMLMLSWVRIRTDLEEDDLSLSEIEFYETDMGSAVFVEEDYMSIHDFFRVADRLRQFLDKAEQEAFKKLKKE